MTTPQLFAASRGASLTSGSHRCFFCGGSCDDSLLTAKYVASSFTERNQVASPASPYVCGGCVEAMRSDLASVPMIDGTDKPSKTGKPNMQVRWFSWIITADKALAATPGNRDELLAACLDPPEPPFAICIADGNKHQLYQTPVNHTRERITVNCEGRMAQFSRDELTDRIRLTMQMVAACGKGGDSIGRMMDPMQDMSVSLQLSRTYDDFDELFSLWRVVRQEPLTHLAMWLTPGKDDCHARLAAAD